MANDISFLILATTLIFFVALAFIVIYIFIYNQRKKRHIEEKQQLQANFNQELLKTQLEVQEQTLTNISRELHDNVTQVLSFVKLNLALETNDEQEKQLKIIETRELVAQAINDLRNLSKSLNYDHIIAIGLVKSLEVEVNRINNSGLLNLSLTIDGDEYSLGEERELILFRIFQESVNNALKYAAAQHFKISLQYSNQLFNLILEDDGSGFSVEEARKKGGLGLRNMQNRAALIGADIRIESSPGNGCRIVLQLNPLLQLTYPDGHDPNSAR